MTGPLPTAEQIDRLLALGAALDRSDVFRPAQGPGHWPRYTAPVLAFIAEAGRPHWSDYDYDPAVEGARLHDPEALAGADLAQVRAMLTYVMRSERFGDGSWGALVESGRVEALLARLAQLRSVLD